MKLAIENVYVFQNGDFQKGKLLVENGKIIADGTPDLTFDGKGALCCPGLIDIHTHGRLGYDFTSASEEELKKMAKDFALHGVTTVLPTLASDTFDNWCNTLKKLERVKIAAYPGVHLEGRWLSPARRGAHAPELLTVPTEEELEKLVSCSATPILRITAAPELDGGIAFLKNCVARGIRFSIGHTDADYATAEVALQAGADCFSHLYNAMPPIHHRAGGAIVAAFNHEEAYAELICDGMHIAPEMVRLAYRNKGAEHFILISDSMAGTGCPDGLYDIAGQTAVVKDGKALTPDGKLAGSTLNLLQGVQNLANFAGVSFGQALRSATETPAAHIGRSKQLGNLNPGADANLFLLGNETEKMPFAVLQNGAWLN